MTKRNGSRPKQEENQADLFGGAAPSLRTARSAKAPRVASSTSRFNPTVKAISTDSLLNVRQAATRLGLSKSTLDKMRGAGKGPRFIRSTDRAIRYDPKDLDAWIDARRG